MSSRRIHKYIGLFMLMPMIAWAATGLVFFIKPGYEGAYEILRLKTYPLEPGYNVSISDKWEEARIVKSILGTHLLVKINGIVSNIDPVSHQAAPFPEQTDLRRLFEDVISRNRDRYGRIEAIEGTKAYTTTGVELELNWDELTFSQTGLDRVVISALYKVHYLQWTPWGIVNQILGIVSLFMLVTLTFLGLRIYFTNRG